MSDQQQQTPALTEEQLRLFNADPGFVALINQYRINRAHWERVRKQHAATDYHERCARYAQYLRDRREFAEEDDWTDSRGRLPRGDDPDYLAFKLQCLYESGYKTPCVTPF